MHVVGWGAKQLCVHIVHLSRNFNFSSSPVTVLLVKTATVQISVESPTVPAAPTLDSKIGAYSPVASSLAPTTSSAVEVRTTGIVSRASGARRERELSPP